MSGLYVMPVVAGAVRATWLKFMMKDIVKYLGGGYYISYR